MLNWVLGALTTDELAPAAAHAYALALGGAATPAWREPLAERVVAAQATLMNLRRRPADAA
jgi:hypothetical protein